MGSAMDPIDHDTGQEAPQKSTGLERLLSPRESNVLRLIGRGLSNKQIAQELKIAPETVKSHAKRIFTKLNAQTRAHAVARALGWRV
jgi:DNA-binding NarL/FixJ family response regulator